MTRPDPDLAWAAFAARDRNHDGEFVGAVKTTGIYCKPSCPARHPKRENVEYFTTPAEAGAAGYRACLRCRPDQVGRDREAVARAAQVIAASERMLTLAELAGQVGYAPHHFQRLFTRDIGISPAAYARGLRARRVEAHLEQEKSVTEAVYDSGYGAASRFYADVDDRLGMTPSAWRDGGRGETIRWAIAQSMLGPMLVAATARGICRLSFDEDETALSRRFHHATIIPDDGTIGALVEGALQAVHHPLAMPDLPIDVAGTAFQQAVWQELRRIPSGETRSYAQIAAAVGKPGAVRATGSANGANHVAVLIPCHRVVRSDGSLGGYAYGLDRKQRLLAAEGARPPAPAKEGVAGPAMLDPALFSG